MGDHTDKDVYFWSALLTMGRKLAADQARTLIGVRFQKETLPDKDPDLARQAPVFKLREGAATVTEQQAAARNQAVAQTVEDMRQAHESARRAHENLGAAARERAAQEVLARTSVHQLRVRVVDKATGLPVPNVAIRIDDGTPGFSNDEGVCADLAGLGPDPGELWVNSEPDPTAKLGLVLLRVVAKESIGIGAKDFADEAPPWHDTAAKYCLVVQDKSETVVRASMDAVVATWGYAPWNELVMRIRATTGRLAQRGRSGQVEFYDDEQRPAAVTISYPRGWGTNCRINHEHIVYVEPVMPPMHKLRVRVLDSATQAPVSNVRLRMDGADHTTNEQGVLVDVNDLPGTMPHRLESDYEPGITSDRALRLVGMETRAIAPLTPGGPHPMKGGCIVTVRQQPIETNLTLGEAARIAKQWGDAYRNVDRNAISRFNFGAGPGDRDVPLRVAATTGWRTESAASGTDLTFVKEMVEKQPRATLSIPGDLLRADGRPHADLAADREHILLVERVQPRLHRLHVRVVDPQGRAIPRALLKFDGLVWETTPRGVLVDLELPATRDHHITQAQVGDIRRTLRLIDVVERPLAATAEPSHAVYEDPPWLHSRQEYDIASVIECAVAKGMRIGEVAVQHGLTLEELTSFNWDWRHHSRALRACIFETTGCRTVFTGGDIELLTERSGAVFHIPKKELEVDGRHLKALRCDREYTLVVEPIERPSTPPVVLAKAHCEHATSHFVPRVPSEREHARSRCAIPVLIKTEGSEPKTIVSDQVLEVVPKRKLRPGDEAEDHAKDKVSIYVRDDLDGPPPHLDVAGPAGSLRAPRVRLDGDVGVYAFEPWSAAKSPKNVADELNESWGYSGLINHILIHRQPVSDFNVHLGEGESFTVRVFYPHQWRFSFEWKPLRQRKRGIMIANKCAKINEVQKKLKEQQPALKNSVLRKNVKALAHAVNNPRDMFEIEDAVQEAFGEFAHEGKATPVRLARSGVRKAQIEAEDVANEREALEAEWVKSIANLESQRVPTGDQVKDFRRRQAEHDGKLADLDARHTSAAERVSAAERHFEQASREEEAAGAGKAHAEGDYRKVNLDGFFEDDGTQAPPLGLAEEAGLKALGLIRVRADELWEREEATRKSLTEQWKGAATASIWDDKESPLKLELNGERVQYNPLRYVAKAIEIITWFDDFLTMITESVPRVGWYITVEQKWFCGKIFFDWGFKEHVEPIIFTFARLGAAITICEVRLEIGFGVHWLKMGAQIYVALALKVTVEGYAYREGPGDEWLLDDPGATLDVKSDFAFIVGGRVETGGLLDAKIEGKTSLEVSGKLNVTKRTGVSADVKLAWTGIVVDAEWSACWGLIDEQKTWPIVDPAELFTMSIPAEERPKFQRMSTVKLEHILRPILFRQDFGPGAGSVARLKVGKLDDEILLERVMSWLSSGYWVHDYLKQDEGSIAALCGEIKLMLKNKHHDYDKTMYATTFGQSTVYYVHESRLAEVETEVADLLLKPDYRDEIKQYSRDLEAIT